MQAPVVSILVPIYNVERYLGECLDSLCGQTLRDIEIVCIDDGSTDSSPSIIAAYAARDERIRVVSKPNTGYGDSMNRGLAEARGRWIGICEPDDFCDKRMYERLVHVGERCGCDMAKANYREHAEGARRDPVARVLDGFPYARSFRPRDHAVVLLSAPSIWTAIYRRDMLVGAGVSFSPTPGASFQDTSFSHQCWIGARSVVLLREGYYHYRIDNEASSSKSGDKVYAVCGEFDRTVEFLRQRGGDALQVFGPMLTVMRHGVYRWNYNRILDEHRSAFAQRWEADLVNAYDEGLLDPGLMTPEFRSLLWHVLDGPEALRRAYPGDIPDMPVM